MRVVSLAPSNTEIIYELGAEDMLIATTSLCDYPEQATRKPSLGGWTEGIDTEKLIELNPDLVLCSDDLQNDIAERLRSEDLEVLQVKPHTLEEVYSSIITIGKALNKTEEAEKTVEKMKKELEEISLQGKKIYCEEWLEPPHFSGNWVPGLIEKIDGKYFAEEGVRSSTFKLEDLKSFDPDYIFLSICGAGENVSVDEVGDREDWNTIKAVENNNVYVLDDSLLNRPTSRLVEAAEKIQKIVES